MMALLQKNEGNVDSFLFVYKKGFFLLTISEMGIGEYDAPILNHLDENYRGTRPGTLKKI